MRGVFAEADFTQYKKLDKDIGDVLHQVYKDKYGGTQGLSQKILALL